MNYYGGSYLGTGDSTAFFNGSSGGRVKVLLREVEACRVCTRRFLSLYPLSSCDEHVGLDSF
ncbi:MAG: hypothetical protein KAS88_00345 [Deltaproteobacteria bacterium]|nr:hypothetical protein [Deltaproteobacteria bacterium]